MADLNDNLLNEASEQFIESSHKFVKPVRYFKSNDPYYWEIDNIPIKQLEENILFLRDQVANNLSISGIGRADLAELKPHVTGFDRVVHVNPGRYTARINDAYNKGINILNEVYADWLNQDLADPIGRTGYAGTSRKKTKEFTLPVSVLKTLAGELIDQPLLDNGLYTFLQHHNSQPLVDGSLEFANSVDNRINPGLDINGLPKTKAAIWRSFGTNYEPTESQNDLQQESVEFTRFWGGAIRTSVVDVSETLSVTIPDFDVTDYSNTSQITPSTRIDLLFIYSHPIDSVTTTIQKPSGGAPMTISAPQLGILKGAGVIALNQGHGPGVSNYTDAGGATAGYFDTTAYSAASGQQSNYFSSENTVDINDLHNRINSTMADQTQTQIGLNGSYSNIPSPEDLLNLTPLFEDQLSKDNMALVGQSVLPIAYVIVKRGQIAIVSNDLFDIRPFMRTAELSYNERAGVAAANPPLSFANPAVGKTEVQKDILNVRDVLMTEINRPNPVSQPVATGTIYGGTKWGPEGLLAEIELYSNGTNEGETMEDKVINILHRYHLPFSVSAIPAYPGWDINTQYFGDNGGLGRNERLFSAVRHNRGGEFNLPPKVDDDAISEMRLSTYGLPTGMSHSRVLATTFGSLFCKKTFTFGPGTLDGFNDFDVRVDLLNCSLMAGTPALDVGGESEIRTGAHQTGVFVEKNFDGGSPKGFTIFVCLGSPAAHEGAPWFGQPSPGVSVTNGQGTQDVFFGESLYFSRVGVISSALINLTPTKTYNITGASTQTGGYGDSYTGTAFGHGDDGASQNQTATFNPMICTYPSVNFTVIGFKDDVPESSRLQVYSTLGNIDAPGII